MAYGDPDLLHLDAMLTNISVGYENNELVGERLFPSVRVAKNSDKYYKLERQGWTVYDDIRAPGSEANELPPMTLSRDTYYIEEHALEDVIPDEEGEQADAGIEPLTESTERVTNTILQNREYAIMTLATATANYATGMSTTLSGTAQWSDHTNSNPITDLKTGRDAIFDKIYRGPTVVIMGEQPARQLEDHPDFIDRIKYSQRGVTTDQLIAELAGIPNYIRAQGGRLTNNPGQTEAMSYMWGKDVVMAYVPPAPARRTPAYGYEFTMPYGGNLMPTERWYEQKRKSTVVRTSRRYDLKLIATDANGKSIAGYLIKSATA